MQCTRRLYAPPGFWQRTASEFSRQAGIALRFEGVTGPQRAFHIVDFESPDSIELSKSMSDVDIGGYSTAAISHVDSNGTDPGHLRFSGQLSSKLPKDRPDVHKTGFAGWRTSDRQRTLFGRSLLDLDVYDYLALRVKSDGRKYFINVQTDSIVPTDLHQHRLYVRQPNEWETVVVSLHGFVRTNGGQRINPQSEMIKDRVRSVGISVMDGGLEPFDLRVHSIWATNWPEEASRSQIAQQAAGATPEQVQDGSIRHTEPEGVERIFR